MCGGWIVAYFFGVGTLKFLLGERYGRHVFERRPSCVTHIKFDQTYGFLFSDIYLVSNFERLFLFFRK